MRKFEHFAGCSDALIDGTLKASFKRGRSDKLQIFGLVTHHRRLPRPYYPETQGRRLDLICALVGDTVPVHGWSGAKMLPTLPPSAAKRNRPQARSPSVAKGSFVLRRSWDVDPKESSSLHSLSFRSPNMLWNA
jgi:hypothetical protein